MAQPNYEAPHTFILLALVTTFICGSVNPISLGFGLPAVALSLLVRTRINIIAIDYMLNCEMENLMFNILLLEEKSHAPYGMLRVGAINKVISARSMVHCLCTH